MSDEKTELLEAAVSLRRAIEPGMPQDALGGPASAGTCLYASVTMSAMLQRFGLALCAIRGGDGGLDGGVLDVHGQRRGHYWIEATVPSGSVYVVDITADQFGWEQVRVLMLQDSTDQYWPGNQDLVDAHVEEIANELGCVDLVRTDNSCIELEERA